MSRVSRGVSALSAGLGVSPRQALQRAGLTVGALIGLKGLLGVLATVHLLRFSTPLPVVILGAITGMTYGLLAAGLVLIYRTSRIINFAHGQIGAFGAAVLGMVVSKYGVPYWISFPLAVVASALAGMVAEAAVVRRLRSAPRLVSVVATLGFGQFLLLFAAAINSTITSGATFPQPSGLPQFQIGALAVTPAYTGMLVLAPVAVIGVAAFLRYSPFGLALRSAAANPEAARLSGIFASRMSSLAWAIAGALSAFSAILTEPTQGYVSIQTFGPGLLLRALAGAALARMESIPTALAAGVGIGVLEQLLLWNSSHGGLVEAALFVIIMVALLAQRRVFGRDQEKGSWAAVQALRPVPEALRRIWLVRNLGLMGAVVGFAGLVALPLAISNSASVRVTGIMAFSIVGLSVGLLTGLGGQLTLGQFAVAGVGAVIAIHVSDRTGNFVPAIVYGAAGAAVASLVIGLPALRLRGLMLTVTTLSFALATEAWLLPQSWALGSGVEPASPRIAGHTLSSGKAYYYFGAALLAVAVVLTRNVRQSGFGRLLVAVRDNEDAARAFTVRASLVKMQGYLIGGFLAGIGGAVFGYSLTRVDATAFPASASVDVVVMTVLGGVSLLAGPMLGAIYVLGIPAFVPLDNAGLAATQLGALLVILWAPRGLGSLAIDVRDRLIRVIGRSKGLDVDAIYDRDRVQATTQDDPAVAEAPVHHRLPPALVRPRAGPDIDHPPDWADRPVRALLAASHLRKSFGGVVAVADVSLTVAPRETVGLIGPNGAGKTTTFELLSGFTPADSGAVVFEERDVSFLRPEERARLGMIRSFQDAALFPTMTVGEVLAVALEGLHPAPFASSLLGYSPNDRNKRRLAGELVGFFGLERYRDSTIQELSTGTRRIVEIACLIAAQPKLLLLDEPSSGVAQRETEALGELLMRLRVDFDLTMVVIEHDIPLIMGISDRIVALADGRVIASGPPDTVRRDPLVVEAYLGGDLRAIERSAGRAPAAAGRR